MKSEYFDIILQKAELLPDSNRKNILINSIIDEQKQSFINELMIEMIDDLRNQIKELSEEHEFVKKDGREFINNIYKEHKEKIICKNNRIEFLEKEIEKLNNNE